jgi:hypothetical protein
MDLSLPIFHSPTENIVVIEHNGSFIVKEGNRRIASLKIIYGIIKNVELPEHIQEKINALSGEWKDANQSVPCAVYTNAEEEFVDRLVARTHGKGETSGRDKWTAVARARHARDHSRMSEPGLDLLEAYLKAGKNLTPQQAERWSGDYPITVLDEAIQKLAPLLGFTSPADLASQYPKKHEIIDDILLDIGMSNLSFKDLRASSPFWGARYNLPPPAKATARVAAAPPTPSTALPSHSGVSPNSVLGPVPVPVPGTTPGKAAPFRAHASNDPKSVRKKLRDFERSRNGRIC